MGEAEIKIRSTNTFRGSRRYVRRLQKRYMPDSHLNQRSADDWAAAGPDASLQVGLLLVLAAIVVLLFGCFQSKIV